jgi:hypothetical protein
VQKYIEIFEENATDVCQRITPPNRFCPKRIRILFKKGKRGTG